jgi:diaminohydroxyphosphoribosylaminopyrimidine deaminase/5-amino-6-(5-phosphoribosylamino)uracil reductase
MLMETVGEDILYMSRCLELAAKGLGLTDPNPLVGAVIVYNGIIIGEGYHKKAGGPHAEVIAINAVKNKSLLPHSTLYVNLEPCSHYGKTPPCANLIVSNGIKKVVIGCMDPNPAVSGKGIKILKEAGITVVSPVMEKEAVHLNRRFITCQTKGRPYVILKWAQSADGFIDICRKTGDAVQPNWITNHTARMLVHKWRSEESAIMAGVNTILSDNPRLDTREWPGKNPIRVLIDFHRRIGDGYHIFDSSAPTWVFTSSSATKGNLRFINLPGQDDNPANVLQLLASEGIQSVLVEGGAQLINSFIRYNCWDEARIFTGTHEFKEGVSAPPAPSVPGLETLFRDNRSKIMLNNI